MNGRCERYAPGKYIVLDPDREDHPADNSTDQEQVDAICASDEMERRPVIIEGKASTI
jgi:hypothetical protein